MQGLCVVVGLIYGWNRAKFLMTEQIIQQAMQLHQAGRLAEAEPLYAGLLAAAPESHPVLHLFGLLRFNQGRMAEALALTERALQAQPDATPTLTNYALVLEALGRLPEALAAISKVVAATPQDSRAWNNRGGINNRLGRSAAALEDFDRAIALDPRSAPVWYNRGVALQAVGRFEEALASYSQAVALNPDYGAARNNRGQMLAQLHRDREALADFEYLLARQPGMAGAWVNRAASLWNLDRIDEALACYDKALALEPDNAQALSSRADLTWARNKTLAPAIADMEHAVRVAPEMDYLRGDLTHLKMYAGDWRDFERDKALLDDGVRAGRAVVHPFIYQGISDSPADLLACAADYAARKFPPVPALRKGVARRPGKIRLGYLCGEFRAQATAYLSAGLYEAHDRARFEVFAFDNTSKREASPMRRRLEAAFGGLMIDITGLSDVEAAARIAAADIDILVNLNGYFGDFRPGIFARRPAPLQANYLGFPGTLGARYMDYILADAVVIPDDERRFYAEQVMRLPHSYQINDTKRAIDPQRPSRAVLGLPEQGFVFCNFNYSYKITPHSFAAWMRILKQVEGSVLWLLETHPLFTENIRRAAAAAGVDPARLILAPAAPVEAHLARLAVADLFLDGLPYNAHTTASDALWAGLPLLTCRGSAFAGRVAASLLNAVGLPELVTENWQDYESLAVALAHDPARLESYRTRLAQNRLTAPLFDTARTTRAIEAAYTTCSRRWQRGEKPAAFKVADE